MGNAAEALGAVGILARGADRPEVRSSLARLARIVREEGIRTLGLAPASDDVAIPPLALALGRTLSETSADPVAVVDAVGSWPCATELLQLTDAASNGIAMSWIAERLAVLTRRRAPPAEALPALAETLSAARTRFAQVVVDLTGLDHLGAGVGAFRLVDGTALVARVGRTPIRQVVRNFREIPEPHRLGVVLTGA